MTQKLSVLTALLCLPAIACSNDEAPKNAAVQFLVQSPFCGPTVYQLRFLIDLAVVGNDTLRDGRTSSRFTTTAGPHRLGAVITGGTFAGFTLDTTVTLRTDTLFTQVVDIYCS